MREYLTEEEKKRGWEIHDKIKNHDFRKQPQRYLLDEYDDLFYNGLYKLVCGWGVIDYVPISVDPRGYVYAFHKLERRLCNVSWDKDPQTISIDVWSNPNIGLINEAIHDFNGIRWRLASYWKDGEEFTSPTVKVTLPKYIETTELLLMIFHHLLEGREVSEVKYPKDNLTAGTYTKYIFERNPRFNNFWTFPYANKDEFYVKDKNTKEK